MSTVVAGSSAPVTRSVGAVISPSRSRTSKAPIASQQAAYPSAGVARSMARSRSAAAGSSTAHSAVDQVPVREGTRTSVQGAGRTSEPPCPRRS
jgi:hypothetical protein